MGRSNQLEIYHIESMGTLDGPGIRTVIFLQGCPLKCDYCHNPDAWLYNQGKGQWRTHDEVIEIIMKNKAYYKKSGGVTFSGGEPLMQSESLLKLILLLKKHNIHVAIDTSGAIFNEASLKVLEHSDLVILDIKAFDEATYKDITRRSMTPFSKKLAYIRKENIKHWIRHVKLPGRTFNFKYLEALASHRGCDKFEVLDYHTMGSEKWETWQMQYRNEYSASEQ